jgi:methionyl aminopeptidase
MASLISTETELKLETEVDEIIEDKDSDDDEEGEGGATITGEKKKKKKKKPKKKKSAAASGSTDIAETQLFSLNPQHMLKLKGYTNSYVKYGQTEEPSIPVALLFADRPFPQGEIQPHGQTKFVDSNCRRVGEEEKRASDRLLETDLYDKLRHASEVHRQVRGYAQSFIKPGIKLIDMCERIEECNRRLVRENGLQAGIGFPTGCSINHVAAHYTPNAGDETVLQYGDVMKIDFGTQIDGRRNVFLHY